MNDSEITPQETIGDSQTVVFALEPCATQCSIFPQPIVIVPLWRKRELQRQREEKLRKQRIERGTAEPVDLGLSVLWASHNVGARGTGQLGFHYKGGQRQQALDVWGEDWRLPTLQEMLELMQHCQWMWNVIDGIPGFVVTGQTGNSIFLQAAGSSYMMQQDAVGMTGRYWCGTDDTQYPDRAKCLEFNQYSGNVFSMPMATAMSVRPVKPKSR